MSFFFAPDISTRQLNGKNIAKVKEEQKASLKTVITSVNIKINKAFTCLVQKQTKNEKKNKPTKKEPAANFKMIFSVGIRPGEGQKHSLSRSTVYY